MLENYSKEQIVDAIEAVYGHPRHQYDLFDKAMIIAHIREKFNHDAEQQLANHIRMQ